jgi:hypothetical protein
LAGGLISGIDIRKAEHVSSLWKYFGYHVVNGRAVKRKKGEKLGFNPDMRVLGYKIADSFVKHRTTVYRQIYEERKRRAMEKLNHPEVNPENCPRYKECMEELKKKATRTGRGVKKPPCAKHIHLRACREMVKEFLRHLWVKWRTMEGLPVSKPYAVQILGHSDKNSQTPRETHPSGASQTKEETHYEIASHRKPEIHGIEASHDIAETHMEVASQHNEETHDDVASQGDAENHILRASQNVPEAQCKRASQDG